jgi:hypothetical protein
MPAQTTRDSSELADILLSRDKIHLIGIDGFDGSGKTFLAGRLAKTLSARHINLDDFLNDNESGFLNHLRYEELQAAANEALAAGRVIVEGDCLRAVLGRIGLAADSHVYVKQVSADGSWHRADFLNLADSVEETLAIEQESAERFEECRGNIVEPGKNLITGLRRDLITYHFHYRPHECADLIFERE